MTDPKTSPTPESQGGSGLLDQQSITFLALIACPILALVCAGMGLVFILQGHLIVGVLFILVLAQVFVAGGLWASSRRKRARDETR